MANSLGPPASPPNKIGRNATVRVPRNKTSIAKAKTRIANRRGAPPGTKSANKPTAANPNTGKDRFPIPTTRLYNELAAEASATKLANGFEISLFKASRSFFQRSTRESVDRCGTFSGASNTARRCTPSAGAVYGSDEFSSVLAPPSSGSLMADLDLSDP